ncbi:Carbon starvation protein A [hydrothermal vent metagenome]|uniref:Carbon starvation protein A n=1 Tax=hydrothermal vent metagenome TaxID=652676 RepID=A0A1W1BCY4_9ZZZZ
MITFILSFVALFLGFMMYGRIVERVFGIEEDRVTPAIRLEDGVDFVPLPGWKIFMIQFLNISGLGPIFGAIAGAMFGPVAFLWIVLGGIVAGGVHDFMSGMLSVRNDGRSVAELVGHYLGEPYRVAMRIISIVLLLLVGVVFVMGPAAILHDLTSVDTTILMGIIFIYYVIATLIPVDKIIGKIYPFFGAVLLFMAIGVGGSLIFEDYHIPELIGNMHNFHANSDEIPIFPVLFITIACGAISGFHATQSPLMARCITNEKQARSVFYGAMLAESIVALIWAAAAMVIFGDVNGLNASGENPASIVNKVSTTMLGSFGGALAILGVVVAPITSGDTAFRSARLAIADSFRYSQKELTNRLYISIPLFVIALVITQVDFSVIWRYFGFTNQLIATMVLWASSAYLVSEGRNYLLTLIPAIFMTSVVTTFLLMSKIGFNLPIELSQYMGVAVAIVLGIIFLAVKDRVYKVQS